LLQQATSVKSQRCISNVWFGRKAIAINLGTKGDLKADANGRVIPNLYAASNHSGSTDH
jgi:hypothetical protein